MAHAVREITNMRLIMRDLGYCQPKAPLESDSQVAISMVKKGCLTNRTEHLALAFNEVKEQNDAGLVFLRRVPGVDNTADLLTKPLPRFDFQKHTRPILNDHWFLASSSYSPSRSFVAVATSVVQTLTRFVYRNSS